MMHLPTKYTCCTFSQTNVVALQYKFDPLPFFQIVPQRTKVAYTTRACVSDHEREGLGRDGFKLALAGEGPGQLVPWREGEEGEARSGTASHASPGGSGSQTLSAVTGRKATGAHTNSKPRTRDSVRLGRAGLSAALEPHGLF